MNKSFPSEIKKIGAVVFALIAIVFFVNPAMSPVFAFPESPPAGYPEGLCYPPYYSQIEKACLATKIKKDLWIFESCEGNQKIDDKYCQKPTEGVPVSGTVVSITCGEGKKTNGSVELYYPGRGTPIKTITIGELGIGRLSLTPEEANITYQTGMTVSGSKDIYARLTDVPGPSVKIGKAVFSGIVGPPSLKVEFEKSVNLHYPECSPDQKKDLPFLGIYKTLLFDSECEEKATKLGLDSSLAALKCSSKAMGCFASSLASFDKSSSSNNIIESSNFCLNKAIREMEESLSVKPAQEAIVAPSKPISVGRGGADGPGGPGAQAKPAPKEPKKTKIVAHIHGQDSGTITGIDTKDGGRVAVGARVTPENSEECIIDDVSLEMLKTLDSDGKLPVYEDPTTKEKSARNLDIEISRKREGESEDDKIVEGNPKLYQNCQSYWANLKGPGTYYLIASYEGDPGNYLASNQVAVEVKIKGNQAEIGTVSTVDVKPSGGSSTNRRISQAQVFKNKTNLKGNVAGVKVEQGSSGFKVSPDKDSSGRLILTPKTTLSNGTLDKTRIPTIHFTVVKILKDGSVSTLFDNANYPNGESQTFDEAELGDLSQVIRFEARTSFNNPGSEYASSQGSLTIDVADAKDLAVAKVEEKPWVKLSSNPYKDDIFAGEIKMTVTASTNYAVEDPVFEVLHNGQNDDTKPASATTNCQDGNGSCEYFMELFYPNGDYSINFKNNGVLADEPLVFSTKSKTPEPSPRWDTSEEPSPAEKIDSIELFYKGDKKWSSEDGGKRLLLDLEPGENVFELVFHYSGDKVVYESFVVVSEPEGSSPAPSSSSTPGPSEAPETPEPSAILEPSPTPEEINPPEPQCTEVRQYNECNGCRTSRRISQDSCGNYEVVDESQDDSSCTSGCPPPEPQQTRPKWYCEGDVIMEEENGQRSVYHDCAEEDESCRFKYTPGYESDAECYAP